jgi:hypothetical protein
MFGGEHHEIGSMGVAASGSGNVGCACGGAGEDREQARLRSCAGLGEDRAHETVGEGWGAVDRRHVRAERRLDGPSQGESGKAIAAMQSQLGNVVAAYDEPVSSSAVRAVEYRALFDAVAQSVIVYQFFPGNRLPTKKRKDSFAWTLGAEISALPGLESADYALFIITEDQYGIDRS